MMRQLALAKSLGIALGALVLAGTLYGGLVRYLGGHVSPWPTYSEVQDMIDKSGAEVRNYMNGKECDDYSNRLARARMALAANPGDMVSAMLAEASMQTLRKIPGCRIP